jgi:hypothetical protein
MINEKRNKINEKMNAINEKKGILYYRCLPITVALKSKCNQYL